MKIELDLNGKPLTTYMELYNDLCKSEIIKDKTFEEFLIDMLETLYEIVAGDNKTKKRRKPFLYLR
jgi:hypothetical protein